MMWEDRFFRTVGNEGWRKSRVEEEEEAEEDCSCCCVEFSVGLVWLGRYHSRARERQKERKKERKTLMDAH